MWEGYNRKRMKSIFKLKRTVENGNWELIWIIIIWTPQKFCLIYSKPYGRECSIDMRSPRLRTQCQRADFKSYCCMSFGSNGSPKNLILVSPFIPQKSSSWFKPSRFYAFLRKATIPSQFANRGTFIFITKMLNKFNFIMP